ncbi:hypothetical protein CLOBOL_03232 [Enterocloster bolteae ATCC BAA-613]|uniref:Uncharacterized protein n=1 Tax=Enterocloster bolteae (strain ATCC BAA-613 / DSM 15670 / CCUG 46953 / JCM 12243 / WAL 16351) TaxID=411902 RepID=A8RS83_ENTBW|nr:hypothetical protein CLOBOL_03232 [Enterocloster bolteae ATCC BAA-613]
MWITGGLNVDANRFLFIIPFYGSLLWFLHPYFISRRFIYHFICLPKILPHDL